MASTAEQAAFVHPVLVNHGVSSGELLSIVVTPAQSGNLDWTASWTSRQRQTIILHGSLSCRSGVKATFTFVTSDTLGGDWLTIHVAGIATPLQAWIL